MDSALDLCLEDAGAFSQRRWYAGFGVPGNCMKRESANKRRRGPVLIS